MSEQTVFTREQLTERLVEDHCDSVRSMAVDDDTSWVADIFTNGWTGYANQPSDVLLDTAINNGLVPGDAQVVDADVANTAP